MANDLIPFKFHNVELRALFDEIDGPLFNANDVCVALGYANPWDALRKHVDNDDLAKREVIDSKGRTQQANFVTEPGLYALIFSSKLEGAKEFKNWVTSEVLPSIRKTGRYELNAVVQSQSPEPAQLTRGQLDVYSFVLEKAGIEGNQLALALDKVVKSETGKSALALAGVQLIAPTQEQLLNPTQLGKELGLSAKAVNKKLEAKGLQVKANDGWELTETGKGLGAVYLDVGKRHSNGTPIRQIKWPAAVVSQLSV